MLVVKTASDTGYDILQTISACFTLPSVPNGSPNPTAGTIIFSAGTLAATGASTVPTLDVSDSSTNSASTAFVHAAITAGGGGGITSLVTAGALSGGTITTTGTVGLAVSTGLTISAAGTIAVTLLGTANTWTAGQRGAVVVLTDTANIATNLALGNNFKVTISANRTLDNPTNIVAGQAGQMVIIQDGTGGHTLAYGSDWKFSDGVVPVLSTGTNAMDILSYYVIDSTHIAVSPALNFL